MVTIEINLPSKQMTLTLLAGGMVGSFLVASLAEVIRNLLRLQQKNELQAKNKGPQVYLVVLTGGPCSGKTSSLQHVKEACAKAGFTTLSVPEVPTLLMKGGASYPGLEGGHRLIAFEIALLRLQLQIEESFVAIGRSLDTPTVVLCDRGALDISAYLMPRDWLSTIQAIGITNAEMLKRYDAVIHLVTAADGAETFYTLENNTARSESAKDARVLDKRIRSAWAQHGHHLVVDNSTDFQGKLDRTSEAIIKGAQTHFGIAEGKGGGEGGGPASSSSSVAAVPAVGAKSFTTSAAHPPASER